MEVVAALNINSVAARIASPRWTKQMFAFYYENSSNLVRAMKPLLVIASVMLTYSLHAQNDGMPFGKIGETDVDRLEQFAKKSGFDWEPEARVRER